MVQSQTDIATPTEIEAICARFDDDPHRMLDILQEVQTRFRCVSPEVMEVVASATGLTRVAVDAVVSFYSFLSDTPKGRVTIRLCDDIIDRFSGLDAVIAAFEAELGIKVGQTSADGAFSLDVTACIGMCDQAPAAMINDVVLTSLTADRVPDIVGRLRQGEAPGLLIGALSFGHLPIIFVPAGPMPSGLPNAEKARIRQLYAEGKVGRDALLECESSSYHSAGTCTFYGTANSNQLVMEAMGLHLPGSSFINPGNELRDELTREAARQACRNTALNGNGYRPLSEIVDEKAVVNGVVALLASGGSTNHTMHLVAMARAAGIQINWDDFSELSDVVPLLTRIYPNGQADINHFQAAGGMGLLLRELLDGGYMHEDVNTILGNSLRDYLKEPFYEDGQMIWKEAAKESLDKEVVASRTEPFSTNGGLKVLSGNLGRAVIKVSAVKPECRVVEAAAVVFHDQNEIEELDV